MVNYTRIRTSNSDNEQNISHWKYFPEEKIGIGMLQISPWGFIWQFISITAMSICCPHLTFRSKGFHWEGSHNTQSLSCIFHSSGGKFYDTERTGTIKGKWISGAWNPQRSSKMNFIDVLKQIIWKKTVHKNVDSVILPKSTILGIKMNGCFFLKPTFPYSWILKMKNEVVNLLHNFKTNKAALHCIRSLVYQGHCHLLWLAVDIDWLL